MNGLDWLIVIILVLSVLHAAAQGFVFELFSLVGTVFGYLLAAWEYPVVARYIAPYVKSNLVAGGAGFLLIFVAVVILAGIAGRIARWATSSVGLRWFDRLLGGAFGFLRGAIAVMVLVMAMASFLPSSRALATSRLAQYFLVAGRAAVYAGPDELKQKFQDGIKAMEQLRNSSTGRTIRRMDDVL
jgi:membrane protein required for colicin V production